MMNSNRNPSPLTLQLVEAMATDPSSTKALRAFHAAQLVKLRAPVKPVRSGTASPFSRFEEMLNDR